MTHNTPQPDAMANTTTVDKTMPSGSAYLAALPHTRTLCIHHRRLQTLRSASSTPTVSLQTVPRAGHGDSATKSVPHARHVTRQKDKSTGIASSRRARMHERRDGRGGTSKFPVVTTPTAISSPGPPPLKQRAHTRPRLAASCTPPPAGGHVFPHIYNSSKGHIQIADTAVHADRISARSYLGPATTVSEVLWSFWSRPICSRRRVVKMLDCPVQWSVTTTIWHYYGTLNTVYVPSARSRAVPTWRWTNT